MSRPDRSRWSRVFLLRRDIQPHIVLAGERPPTQGEKGPQKFVVLSDDLDDVIFKALTREAAIARKAKPRVRRAK